MFKNVLYWTLFPLIVAGCAGEPVRVHLPPTHPADHRAQEPEFRAIPNPFTGTPEGASADSTASEPDESKPESDHSHHHGHHSTGSDHSMPEGPESVEGGEHHHPMEHKQ